MSSLHGVLNCISFFTFIHVHTADADATKQFRRVGVGGVYWATHSRANESRSRYLLLPDRVLDMPLFCRQHHLDD